jgi:hypothetical protein
MQKMGLIFRIAGVMIVKNSKALIMLSKMEKLGRRKKLIISHYS